jgi:hypothetical protein
MADGRTDGRMAFKKRFSAFFESYSRFIQNDKTRIWSKKRFSAFFESYPRFQKDKTRIYSHFIQKDKTRISSKKLFQPFLSQRIKRGNGSENYMYKEY